jgi:hypothetical protein
MEHTTDPRARVFSLTRIRRGGVQEHRATSGFLDDRVAFTWMVGSHLDMARSRASISRR